MNAGFAAASATALVTWAVHTFVGGVYVARPLLAARDLTAAWRWLNYYCWHMATITLLVMTGGFAWAAVSEAARELALVFTAMAAAFSVLSAWAAIRGRIAPYRFPSTTLFAVMAVAGLAGLML